MEYGRDYVEVEAETKREAMVKGLREFRRQSKTDWRKWRWWDEGNPFRGMIAYPVCLECEAEAHEHFKEG